MKRLFSSLTIKHKMMAITMLTTGIVLLVASAVHVFGGYALGRKNLEDSSLTLASIIGINGAAALAFQDPEAANELLATLVARPDIVSAHIYRLDGSIFAGYLSEAPEHRLLQGQITYDDVDFQNERKSVLDHSTSVSRFKPDFLDIISPILIDNRALGIIDIQVDLQPLKTNIIKQIGSTMIFLPIAFLLVYLMASLLQRVISVPVKNLSEAMSRVSRKGDYSLRIEHVGDDELGQLSDGFNAMIEQIQNRDGKLEEMVRELELAKNQAETTTASKSSFLASMSHEIRTPMNGVMGMTSLLFDTELNDIQKSYLETIDESARSLLKIINDILDFSKIESGNISLENIEFDLHECIQQVDSLFRSSAELKGLQLISDIADDVPKTIKSDPGRLRQVLINLVGNAVKFTESGSIKVTVSSITHSFQSAILLFEVSDTGIGISPQQQDIIFSEFSQAEESIFRKFGGTGLGLAISRRLIELMGGEIGVNSDLGKGSCFWFRLPADLVVGFDQDDAHFGNQPATEDGRAGANQRPLSLLQKRRQYNASVLVAEDNIINQRVVREILQAHGIDPIIVDNGRAAVETIVNEHVDLVIMDIMMPEMDGIEATSKIREQERSSGSDRRIPIIAFTANAMMGDREKYLRAGMDDYLSKPLDLENFSLMLEHWMKRILTVDVKNQNEDEK